MTLDYSFRNAKLVHSQAMNKLSLLAQVLRKSPPEFLTRVWAAVRGRLEPVLEPRGIYATVPFDEAVSQLEREIGRPISPFLREEALSNLRERTSSSLITLEASGTAPFKFAHNSDDRLSTLEYALCRALQPAIVVETGVAYGVSSSYILAALAMNERGHLHSIDFPPLGADQLKYVGYLVPAELKDRWTLHLGPSQTILPSLMKELGGLDFFIHDSLHTGSHMRMELATAHSGLRRPGLVMSDDIEGNRAFAEFVTEKAPSTSVAVQEASKPGIFGIAYFGSIPY